MSDAPKVTREDIMRFAATHDLNMVEAGPPLLHMLGLVACDIRDELEKANALRNHGMSLGDLNMEALRRGQPCAACEAERQRGNRQIGEPLRHTCGGIR